MLFSDILLQQYRRKHRHEGEREEQGAEQCEAERVGHRTEHLAFHLLEREDGDERGDDNQLGKEHGAGTVVGDFPNQSELQLFVEFFHAYFAGVGVECHKQSFDHYYRSVDDDTEVDGPHGNQVGTHSLNMKTDKGKEQRQRYHNGHVDGSTPVGHEQKYDDGHQDKPFNQVVQHGVYRYVNQVGTVVVWYNLDVLWQLCLYVGHFLLQQRNDSTRVVTAVHQYHTFHYIVLVADAALSESGQTRFLHGSYILDEDRRAVDILHHYVLKVLDVGNQSDAAYYVGLCPFVHDVASYVEVTFLNGLIKFQVGDSVAVKLVRIDLHLKCLHFAAEAHHIGHARYGAQLPVEHPVLQGLQFPH